MNLNPKFSAALQALPVERLLSLESDRLFTLTQCEGEPIPPGFVSDRVIVGRVDGTMGYTLYFWEGTEDQAVSAVQQLQL